MPEATLQAFAEHGEAGQILPVHARYCDQTLAEFAGAGIDIHALAAWLQEQGAQAFVRSWNELLECLRLKSEALRRAG
jgi:transaldolase